MEYGGVTCGLSKDIPNVRETLQDQKRLDGALLRMLVDIWRNDTSRTIEDVSASITAASDEEKRQYSAEFMSAWSKLEIISVGL
jgi:hypothetical protein